MSGASDMFLQSHEKGLTDERHLTDRIGWWMDTVKVGDVLCSRSVFMLLNEVARPNSGKKRCIITQQQQPIFCFLN